MKILFVANEIPFPPDNGVKIPTYHAMRLMYQAGHKVALAVLTAEAFEVEDRFKAITESFCDGRGFLERVSGQIPGRLRLKALLRQKLPFVERYCSAEFRRKLSELIGEFQPDVIHFDLVPMAQYWNVTPPRVGAVASINDSYTLILENALRAGHFRGFEYVYRKWQYYHTRNYERTVYEKFHQVHVMSEIDKRYLVKLNPVLKVSVIPNGAEDSLFDLTASTCSKSNIIFVATLSGTHLKGLQRFLTQAWPIIVERDSEIVLHVVGKIGEEARVLKEQYSQYPGIKFTGYVPSLPDVYRMCGVAIAPIDQNCGIVNKVIEAMAAGLAVVGFANTFAGIPQGKAGVHFVQATDYRNMGHEIVELLANERRCREIKVAAHELAKSYYSWSSRGDSYSQMYASAAEAARHL